VRKTLDTTDGPAQADATVDVMARTSFGNIVVCRAAVAVAQRAD